MGKFSLKKAAIGLGAVGLAPGLAIPAIGGLIGAKSLGLGKLFGGPKEETTPADPEAAILKGYKVQAAGDEMAALKGFRERLGQPIDEIINNRMQSENQGYLSQASDQERKVGDMIAQRGLANSAVGFNAQRLAGDEARSKVSQNLASLAERLDNERLKRLTEYKNAAGSTLANQDVGIRFQATTKERPEGFGTSLVKAGLMSAVGAAGKKAGGGGFSGGSSGGGGSSDDNYDGR